MKLKANTDTITFLNAVKQCRGEVLFKTIEGDVLNLKSTLSSYVFCAVNSAPEMVESSRVECSDPEDYRLLGDYLEDT